MIESSFTPVLKILLLYVLQKKIYVQLGVQTFHVLKTVQKCKNAKIPKNSKILKNYVHFGISHLQINLKQFSNICENVVYYFLLCRGVEK